MAVNPRGLQAEHRTLRQSIHIVQASPGSARESAIHPKTYDAARDHYRLLQVRDAEAQHGTC